MTVLYSYSFWETAKGILWVTLIILILIIAYRKLLRVLGKGNPSKEDYCVLYGLEQNPSKGEVEFYFTSDKTKLVKILILDLDFEEVIEVSAKECHIGGNIIRFDSSKVPNGNYFFCLKTDNQKTVKKMSVQNG